MVNEKLFKFLRALSEYLIVAFGSLYLGLSQIWDLPFGDKISDTCVLLATFVGIIVQVDRKIYEKDKYTPVEEEIEFEEKVEE